MDFVFAFLGFVVGFLVGLTGIGGGALMTPSLILLGMEPLKAVGTDLLYVTGTKIFGTVFHHKMGEVRHDISIRLLAGSVPAVLLGGFLLRIIDKDSLNSYLTLLLGLVLVVSAVISTIKKDIRPPVRPRIFYLYVLGFIVGLTVQFTSVGAGVIVSFMLINLAKISPSQVVGITLFYGLLLSFLSFFNYASIGSVDYGVAFTLISGSIFGVFAGTRISTRTESKNLKKIINLTIAIIGVITLLKYVL